MRLTKLLIAVAFGAIAAVSVPSFSAVISFSTAQSEFTPNVLNQGWWSDSISNSDINTNHNTGGSRRSFYTFDLSTLSETVTGATLRIQRGNQTPDVLLSLWDINTPAATLNFNENTSPAIFADLGSGINYGSFVIPEGLSQDYLLLSLNSDAIAQINAAINFFSIGASTTSGVIFGGSNGDVTYLDLITVAPASVPEPATTALLGLGLLCFASFRTLKTRKS